MWDGDKRKMEVVDNKEDETKRKSIVRGKRGKKKVIGIGV